MANAPLTQQSVQNALSQMAQWFPEHAANINTYQSQLTQNIVNNTAPAAGSALAQITMPAAPAATAAVNLLSISISPCEEAIAEACVDAGFFILGLVGINETCNTNVTRSLLNEMGQETLNGFYSMFQDYKAAQSTYVQAKALFSIAGSFYKAGGFKVLFDAWEGQASWFDWVKTGVVAIAQFTVWFASDGTAFIGEVVLVIASAVTLTQGIAGAVETCDNNNCAPVPASNPATTTFVPSGSYTFTASDIVVTMSANCKNIAGQYIPSQLNLTSQLALVQVENNNGVLEAQGMTTQLPTTFTPLGQYNLSSEDVQVVLTASCKTIQGNVVSSSLNITGLALGQSISNINGVLTVDQN